MDHARHVGELKLGEESVENFEVFMDLLRVVRRGGEALLPQVRPDLLQGLGHSFGQWPHLFGFKLLESYINV